MWISLEIPMTESYFNMILEQLKYRKIDLDLSTILAYNDFYSKVGVSEITEFVQIIIFRSDSAVEYPPVKRLVTGSIPTFGAKHIPI